MDDFVLEKENSNGGCHSRQKGILAHITFSKAKKTVMVTDCCDVVGIKTNAVIDYRMADNLAWNWHYGNTANLIMLL